MALRGLHPNREIGLSREVDICEDEGYGYPCYIPRGRYDNGVYISVEYSDAYKGFAKGYYIVMVASGEVDKSLLKQIRTIVPDAYIKKSAVYMGCMH